MPADQGGRAQSPRGERGQEPARRPAVAQTGCSVKTRVLRGGFSRGHSQAAQEESRDLHLLLTKRAARETSPTCQVSLLEQAAARSAQYTPQATTPAGPALPPAAPCAQPPRWDLQSNGSTAQTSKRHHGFGAQTGSTATPAGSWGPARLFPGRQAEAPLLVQAAH